MRRKRGREGGREEREREREREREGGHVFLDHRFEKDILGVHVPHSLLEKQKALSALYLRFSRPPILSEIAPTTCCTVSSPSSVPGGSSFGCVSAAYMAVESCICSRTEGRGGERDNLIHDCRY